MATFDATDISGKFLIAAPGLEDPNFRQTVVLVCEHSEEGAFGLIINRVLMNSFQSLMKAFEIERSAVDMPIFYGGPVKPEQGYVIYSPHSKKYGNTRIDRRIAVTASRDILYDIAKGRGPERYVFALGFSGWGENQLEEELMTNSWIVAPMDYNIIFNVPVGDRWKVAAGSVGVDFGRFHNYCGFA